MKNKLLNTGSYARQFDLTGRVSVVTGGAGILGRHFCAALADCGAEVAVVDIDQNAASELAGELGASFGVRAVGYAVDISDADAIAPLVDRVEAELGPVGILHNNAATKGRELDSFFADTESYSSDTWREVMAVNLDGAFQLAKEIGGRMAGRGGGSIIQTGSIYGVVAPDQRIYEGSEYMGRPISSPAVYSASKAGLHGLTQYLAAYWGSKRVRVNTLSPGGVSSGQNGVFESRYSARVPLARMAQCYEMTGSLIFLASDASSYLTGQNIVVDGGLSAW